MEKQTQCVHSIRKTNGHCEHFRDGELTPSNPLTDVLRRKTLRPDVN